MRAAGKGRRGERAGLQERAGWSVEFTANASTEGVEK